MSVTVELGNGIPLMKVRIKTTIATNEAQVDEVIQAMMSNSLNHKRLIGLDLIPIRSSTDGFLQVCDSSQCLIVRLHSFSAVPESIYNFLLLLNFAFAGFGIKDTKARLEKDYGLVCKNIYEVGQEMWSSLGYTSQPLRDIIKDMRMPPTSSISKPWGKGNPLTEDQIKVAVSNAFFARQIAEATLPL